MGGCGHGHGHGEGCVVVYCGDEHGKGKDNSDCCDRARDANTFVAGVDVGVITPVATELPISLLTNPANSGKIILIHRRALSSVGSSDENVLFKFYFNPVVVAQGSPVAAVNLNQSGFTVPTSAQLWSTPTLGGNGTLIDAFNVDSAPFEIDEPIVLGEGHSLLITQRANAENTRAAAWIYWTECKKHHRKHHDHEMPPTP